MNTDFEQHLRRQPLRAVPGEWREEILRRAAPGARLERDAGNVGTEFCPGPSPVSSGGDSLRAFEGGLRRRLRQWLWPSPVAWSALAACWAATLILNQLAQPSVREQARAERDARLAAAYHAAVQDPAAMTLLADPRPIEASLAPSRPRPGVGRTLHQFNLLPV